MGLTLLDTIETQWKEAYVIVPEVGNIFQQRILALKFANCKIVERNNLFKQRNEKHLLIELEKSSY